MRRISLRLSTAPCPFASMTDVELCDFLVAQSQNDGETTRSLIATSRNYNLERYGPVEGYKRWRCVTERLARVHSGESSYSVWMECEAA